MITLPILAIVMTPMAEPHPAMITPFVILLLAIALMPFIHKHHWENHYAEISIGLGLVTVVYYLVALHDAPRMLSSLVDYVAFMALTGSLYVIAGGIHIHASGRATPAVNTALLAMGTVLGSAIGTTGASMLLIRPFLRINKQRVAAYHVVFFIFLVGNVGGALTPLGPPLFLGYLKGIPFFWLAQRPEVLLAWLLCVGVLLAVFFVWDTRNSHSDATETIAPAKDRLLVDGSHNFIWLFVVVALVLAQKSVWLQDMEHWPAMTVLGNAFGWDAAKAAERAVTLTASLLMLGVACVAHKVANQDALRENDFNFGPVREVGFLFLGIFATMVPALDLLEKHAGDLGITTARQFFWGSGCLSSVLDNAPTYLNFLAAAFGLHHLTLENHQHVQAFLDNPMAWKYLVAVSLGSTLFGGCTYVGNGPNFMVKSIAESSGVKCPGFFGYLFKYALPILIPLFAVVAWLFLR